MFWHRNFFFAVSWSYFRQNQKAVESYKNIGCAFNYRVIKCITLKQSMFATIKKKEHLTTISIHKLLIFMEKPDDVYTTKIVFSFLQVVNKPPSFCCRIFIILNFLWVDVNKKNWSWEMTESLSRIIWNDLKDVIILRFEFTFTSWCYSLRNTIEWINIIKHINIISIILSVFTTLVIKRRYR